MGNGAFSGVTRGSICVGSFRSCRFPTDYFCHDHVQHFLPTLPCCGIGRQVRHDGGRHATGQVQRLQQDLCHQSQVQNRHRREGGSHSQASGGENQHPGHLSGSALHQQDRLCHAKKTTSAKLPCFLSGRIPGSKSRIFQRRSARAWDEHDLSLPQNNSVAWNRHRPIAQNVVSGCPSPTKINGICSPSKDALPSSFPFGAASMPRAQPTKSPCDPETKAHSPCP